MITTEVTSTRYEDGKRISSQIVTYTRSEDVQLLADLLRQFESVENQLAIEKDPVNINQLNIYKSELEEKLKTQQEYVDGYPRDAV